MSSNILIYTICRYFAAFMLLMYGFAKINGSQFTVVDWVLDEPLGEVPGFWLTWYYFGYSTGYMWFISLAEIGGGILLLFRRTTLMASLLVTGVMINIILIDIFFRIDVSALSMALLITVCMLFVIGHHWKELTGIFWTKQNQVTGSGSRNLPVRIGKGVVRGCIIILPVFLTYFIAHYNNRFPTPVDGTWEVINVTGDLEQSELPTRIYFEYNRAYMARFRYPDSLSSVLHFTVAPEDNSLDIWQGWLRQDEKVFSGEYDLRGDTLVINGMFDQKEAGAIVRMRRIR